MGWFTLVGFGFVVVIVHFTDELMIGLFTADIQTLHYAKPILTTLAVTSLATILIPVYNAFHTAQGNARSGLLLTLFRYLVLLIPLSLMGLKLMGLPGILLGMLLAHLLSAGIAWQLGQNSLRTASQEIANPELKPA